MKHLNLLTDHSSHILTIIGGKNDEMIYNNKHK